MARLRCSLLNGRGIADFDEFIHKKFPIILRSCLEALYFDPTTLIEIAVSVLTTFVCSTPAQDSGPQLSLFVPVPLRV